MLRIAKNFDMCDDIFDKVVIDNVTDNLPLKEFI